MENPQNNIDRKTRLAFFTENNPRPVVEINVHGKVLYQNPAAKKTFPDLEKMGVKHPYLFDLKNIVKLIKKANGDPFSRDVKIGERWFRHFFYYMPAFKSIVIYGLDITDKRLAERSLQESERRYRSLFKKMSEGYALHEIVLDNRGKPYDYRFLDLNPAFERLSGIMRISAVGKTMRQIFPKKEPEFLKDYGQVALTGKPIYIERYNKESDKYYEVIIYRPDEMQFAVLFLDITHLKNNEKEADNFISVMSHELRNPLTPILGSAQLIVSRAKNGATNGEIHEYAKTIERQSKNMVRLLDDLLDTARLRHHKMKLAKEMVNIYEVVDHAVKATHFLVEKQQQKISISLPPSNIYLYADPVRLEQIIVNLINNAVKYTKPKGHIWIQAAVKNNRLQIKIKDNGSGIDPKKISTIFELFNKSGHPFITTAELGIGLNITKKLIQMHGGDIVAKSKGENRGSEFIVTFPILLKKIQNEAKKPKGKSTNRKRTSRLLIVDDNRDILTLLHKMLKDLGHEIKTSTNGLEAIKIAKTFKPDIALIDIGLPGISGYRVAEEIRAQSKHRNEKITLIAITGYGQTNDKRLSKMAGFDHHLTKPVDIDSLTKLIGRKS